LPTTANREDVQRLLAQHAHLVEVLPADEYEAEHLPGALNIPLKTLNRQSTGQFDRDRPVIVYCWDQQ
jgi:rhodanese-related sulfurtransferase